MHFDWTINPTNLLVIVGLIMTAARWTVRKIVGQIHRIDLIERAVVNAGWLRRRRNGTLEVVDRQGV